MWKDKLQEIIQEKKIYGEKVNIGATEEEIENFPLRIFIFSFKRYSHHI